MPRPVQTIVVIPDVNGVVVNEQWDNADNWQSFWNPPHGSYLAPYADDGLMGGKYAGPFNGPEISRVIFDHTKPFTYKFTARLYGYYGDGIWIGVSVWLCSEGTKYWGTTNGEYGFTLFDENSGGDTAWYTGSVYDVEQEWDPVAGKGRARVKLHVNGTWSAWNENLIINADELTRWWPIHWWAGATANGTLHIGPATISGTRVWGAFDQTNWDIWALSASTAYNKSADQSQEVGGLFAGTYAYNYFGNGRPTTLQDYSLTISAQSPAIGLQQYVKYNELWFDTKNDSPGHGGFLKIYLRNNADDSLISDAYVPGNSTGLISSGTDLMQVGPGPARIRKINLSGIPAGTIFYIDIQGQTMDSGGSLLWVDNPRVLGVWVTFQQPNQMRPPIITEHSGAA